MAKLVISIIENDGESASRSVIMKNIGGVMKMAWQSASAISIFSL